MPEARPYIGGQAVLEGVMMRSPHSLAVAVRRRSGRVEVRERPVRQTRTGPASWPLLRGMLSLVEALKLGTEALRWSSERYEADHDDEAPGDPATPPAAPPASPPGVLTLALLVVAMLVASGPDDAAAAAASPPEGEPPPAPRPPDPVPRAAPDESAARRVLSVLTIVLPLGLFIVLPQALAAATSRFAHLDLDVRSVPFQAMTGVFKLAVVVGYLLLIRRVPEIRRVFQFHGAEHKTISTYEALEPLDLAHARGKTTLHPRCGTTFLVMVALVSIIVFSAIGPLLPHLGVGKLAENAMFLALKLPFLPVIAAFTFELQRFSARYCTTGPLRALLWPGFVVQRITTIEPDDAQLEIALASLRVTLWREADPKAAPSTTTDATFDDYAALAASAGFEGRAAFG